MNTDLKTDFDFSIRDYPRHPWFVFAFLALVFAVGSRSFAAPTEDHATVILVVGASGEDDFEPNFSEQVTQWEKACARGGCTRITIGIGETPAGTASDYDKLKQAIAAEPKEGTRELWLVLIGHGTYNGKEAKFNLRGPDVSAAEIADWLKPFKRPLAIVDTSAASAPFIAKLSDQNRVVITATRSGNEQNFARLGKYLAAAWNDPKSDLDQDGQTSLLEAFLAAAARVADFYKTEGRLATEHALIDDNGDGLGTPADWFRGTRATKKAQNGASLDGTRARQFHLVRSEAEQKLTPEQRAKRDELELAIEMLREQKPKLSETEYYRRLEVFLLELAKVYHPPSGT